MSSQSTLRTPYDMFFLADILFSTAPPLPCGKLPILLTTRYYRGFFTYYLTLLISSNI